MVALKGSKGEPGSLKMECLSSSPRKVFANPKSLYTQNLTDIGYSSVTFWRWKSLIKSVHAKKTRPPDLGAHTRDRFGKIKCFFNECCPFLWKYRLLHTNGTVSNVGSAWLVKNYQPITNWNWRKKLWQIFSNTGDQNNSCKI